MIRNLKNQGLSKTKIAESLGVTRKTVSKYLKHDTKPNYKRGKIPSLLDCYKDYINDRLSNYNLTSEKIFEEIQKQGYQGKYGIVNLYVREIKQDYKRKAVLRFETFPGEQSQIDWAYCGKIFDVEKRREIKVYCFAIILGYSRVRYIEFFSDQKMASFLQGHNNAFKYFGGYSKEILYDNLKSVVINRRLRAKDSDYNKKFMDFAGYYGFAPILCRPYKPGTKGKIEKTIDYVKRNFLAGEDFNSLTELNKRALDWLNKVNNKVHQTTKEIPFERLKKENLISIENKRLYDLSLTEYRKVNNDSHISFRCNFYSVPFAYAFKEVSIKVINDELVIKYQDKEIARHLEEKQEKGKYITNPKHLECLKELRMRYRSCKKVKKNAAISTSFSLIVKKKIEEVEKRDLILYERVCDGK